MPEIRQNIATQEWVVIATERAKRPEDFIRTHENKKVLSAYVETCPFCPVNEHLAPPETFSLKDKAGKWLVRSIPNKFSALSSDGELVHQEEGIKRRMIGVGIHEVIIETSKHNLTTALLNDQQVGNILKIYKHRYLEALNDKRVESVIIFKNHGPAAGTSLEHPHSQIIATPVVPSQIRTRIEKAMRYYDDRRRCVFCEMINEEIKLQERIISESSDFVAFIPYAALSPFHIWILPKRHISCFPQIDEAEMMDLACLLKIILKKIYLGLDNPDFNYVIRSLPGQVKKNAYFHCYISVIPRVTKTAGFELGSGMFINTALPEKSAEFLRNIKT